MVTRNGAARQYTSEVRGNVGRARRVHALPCPLMQGLASKTGQSWVAGRGFFGFSCHGFLRGWERPCSFVTWPCVVSSYKRPWQRYIFFFWLSPVPPSGLESNYLCSPVTILGRLLSRLVCDCSVDGGPMGTIVDLSSKIGMECLVAARGRPQDARSVLRSPWRLVHGAVVARRPPRQGPWARSVPLKPREWASLW